jgi:hypothetical protein
MHARMLCINAPLQLCNKQRSAEAQRKHRDKTILKALSPTDGTRAAEIGAYRSLTSYCKIQGIYASPLLGRRLELAQRGDYRNSGHGGWSMLSTSSKPSPLHKVVNITLVRTGTDLYHAISTVCTRVPSRPEETALRREAGACIHVVAQTGSHLRYSSRRTS